MNRSSILLISVLIWRVNVICCFNYYRYYYCISSSCCCYMIVFTNISLIAVELTLCQHQPSDPSFISTPLKMLWLFYCGLGVACLIFNCYSHISVMCGYSPVLAISPSHKRRISDGRLMGLRVRWYKSMGAGADLHEFCSAHMVFFILLSQIVWRL